MYYNPDNSCRLLLLLSVAMGIFDEEDDDEDDDDDSDSLSGLDDSPTGISWMIP
jgi:hypothetical protein